jgi:hypothetical protein
MTTHNAFPLIIAAQQEIEKGIHPCVPSDSYTPAQQRNRDFVVKCLNKLTTHSERSGTEVATLLLGKELQYRSHTFSKAFITTFVNELTPPASSSTTDEAQNLDLDPNPNPDDGDLDVHPEDDNGAGESFSINVSPDKTSLVITNQRVDYTLRHKDLHVGLYDFAAEFRKERRPADKKAKAKFPENSFLFDDQHPQFLTHMLVRLRNPHSFHVPVIVGPTFPSKEVNPERYYMLFLVLFKPFFAIGDLKTHDTWELTYGHWWSTLSDIDKSRLSIYDTNISALSSGREQQKSEQEQRQKLRAEQGLDTEDDQTKKFASFDPFDDMFSPPTSADGFLTSASPESSLKIPQPDPKTGVGLFALGALLALSTNGALRSKVTSHSDSESDHEENSPDFLVSLTEKSHFSSSSTVKQLQQLINKAKEKSIQSQQQQDQTTQANANSKHQRRSESDTVTDDTILLDMIAEFTLNEEQADVFKKVGGTFLSEIRDPKKPPPQVKLTLTLADHFVSR